MKNNAKAFRLGTDNYAVDYNGVRINAPNRELSQKIAASLNLFDTLLQEFQEFLEPDAFTEYIVGGSWIAKIGYDEKKSKLKIWKMDGKTFTHEGVPSDIFTEVVGSASVGAAYNNFVRGKYPIV